LKPPLQRAFGFVLALVLTGGCKWTTPAAPFTPGSHDPKEIAKPNEERRMWMTVGERRFAITLAGSKTAEAFAARLPLTLDMAELNGNEKYADLPETLPTRATRPGTMRTGDLMLYVARTLVVFYASFSSSYS